MQKDKSVVEDSFTTWTHELFYNFDIYQYSLKVLIQISSYTKCKSKGCD